MSPDDHIPFRALLNAAPDGILVCDQRGSLVLANREAERMFGYDHDELIGRPLEILIPEAQRARHAELVASFVADPRVRPMATHLELHGRHKDGSLIAVEVSLSPFTEGGELLIIAGIRDISDRRRMQRDNLEQAEELRRARAQAEAASAAKSEFLSSMSHELRTPLNAILGFAQLLERDRKQPLSERQIDRLGQIVRGGEHLLRLIDDVLDLARIEAGRISVSCEPVALGDLLDEVVHTLQPMAARTKIKVVTAAVPRPIPRVLADRTRLMQVLMNFGSNAIKYGKPHGHVTLRAELQGERIRLAVADDGIGIPEDKRDKIFEPFQRAGQEAGPIEGTGIGLTISKRLAELMNGAIGFRSEVGRGSEFWIDLPIQRAQAADKLVVREAPGVGLKLASGAHRHAVVYVEDNPSNIAFMRDVLEELPGVELLTAPSAEIGLELIRGRQPEVVIMDVNLPGMSGLDAARRLHEWPETRAIPIIGLSAAALARDKLRAEAAGFYRYLTKPVNIDELIGVLEQLLEDEAAAPAEAG